ncbi:MAG TPA: hypothetical protein VID74_05645 [Gemmatimonadales bacterium]
MLSVPPAFYHTLTSRDRTIGRASCTDATLRCGACRVIVRAMQVGVMQPGELVRGGAAIADLRALAELHGRTFNETHVGP